MKRILPYIIAAFIFFTALLPTSAAPAIQRAAGSIYVVQRGDTLYSIAREYDTTVDGLREANGLSSDLIWVGQVLVIGSTTGTGQTTHTVVSGDTLYSLARRYGTSVDAIMKSNHLASTNIYVGQQLIITTSSVLVTGNTTYIVVQGDTLFSIARRYGTSVDAIMALNGLSSATIYVGQPLIIGSIKTPLAPIPALPATTATPTVNSTPVASPTGATATPTPSYTPSATPSPSPTLTPTVVPTVTPTLNPLTPTPTTRICDPSYPDFCLTPGIADLDCDDIPYTDFTVFPPDPHDFDRESDGIGCES